VFGVVFEGVLPQEGGRMIARTYMASKRFPSILLRWVWTCSEERALISFWGNLRGLTASTTFVGMSAHSTACFRALCKVTWMYWTVLGDAPEPSFLRYRPWT
jgi:hypothetical protein